MRKEEQLETFIREIEQEYREDEPNRIRVIGIKYSVHYHHHLQLNVNRKLYEWVKGYENKEIKNLKI